MTPWNNCGNIFGFVRKLSCCLKILIGFASRVFHHRLLWISARIKYMDPPLGDRPFLPRNVNYELWGVFSSEGCSLVSGNIFVNTWVVCCCSSVHLINLLFSFLFNMIASDILFCSILGYLRCPLIVRLFFRLFLRLLMYHFQEIPLMLLHFHKDQHVDST